jgi:hypothetical protein
MPMFHDDMPSDASSSTSNSKKSVSSRVIRYTHNPYSSAPDRKPRRVSPAAAALVGLNGDASAQQFSYSSSSNGSSNNASFAAAPAPVTTAALVEDFTWSAPCATPVSADATLLHQHTLHKALIGRVSFVPYPTEAVAPPADAYDDSVDEMTGQSAWARLFIGQVPFKITVCQLQWLFATFVGPDCVVRDAERITKKSRVPNGGPRLPTGCLHANIRCEFVARACDLLNRRALIDDSGVFYAATPAEQYALDQYVQLLECDPRRRFPDRPHRALTVEPATSHFFPSQPRWVSNTPAQEQFLTVSRGFYSADNKQSVRARAAPVMFRQQHQQQFEFHQYELQQHQYHEQPVAAAASGYDDMQAWF